MEPYRLCPSQSVLELRPPFLGQFKILIRKYIRSLLALYTHLCLKQSPCIQLIICLCVFRPDETVKYLSVSLCLIYFDFSIVDARLDTQYITKKQFLMEMNKGKQIETNSLSLSLISIVFSMFTQNLKFWISVFHPESGFYKHLKSHKKTIQPFDKYLLSAQYMPGGLNTNMDEAWP